MHRPRGLVVVLGFVYMLAPRFAVAQAGNSNYPGRKPIMTPS
jgi:hypothetical protein